MKCKKTFRTDNGTATKQDKTTRQKRRIPPVVICATAPSSSLMYTEHAIKVS